MKLAINYDDDDDNDKDEDTDDEVKAIVAKFCQASRSSLLFFHIPTIWPIFGGAVGKVSWTIVICIFNLFMSSNMRLHFLHQIIKLFLFTAAMGLSNSVLLHC